MPRYIVPSFEIETIEEFSDTHDDQMQDARLTNGWDIRIPAHVALERLPEPPVALQDGYYTLVGYKPTLRRYTDSFDGKAVWLEWDGAEWAGCGMVSHMTEDNEIIRLRLNYLGGN